MAFSKNTGNYVITSTNSQSLVDDQFISVRKPLINIAHTITNSSTVTDNQYYWSFQQWCVWKNSLAFPHLSLDNTVGSSTRKSYDGVLVKSRQLYEDSRAGSPLLMYQPQAIQYSRDNVNARKIFSKGTKCCTFCQTNNESIEVYTTHTLHNPDTKKLECPILRRLVCQICGATGDQAHTLFYCPVRKANAYGDQCPLFSKIKKSSRLASGKKRV